VLVLSYESFYLSDRTFAILGPSTDLQKSGLSLRYGQFIDPLFDGKLEVGIHNPFDEEINLKLGDKLGKLCFFDISDTYPITSKRVSDEYAEKLIRRQKMQQKYGIPTGIYDEDVTAFAREQEAYREFDKDDD